jgi:hypothetical protein
MKQYLRLGYIGLYLLAVSASGWSTPTNLGSEVNSSSNEINANIGIYHGYAYLYFSSDRGTGIGGLDNYYSKAQTPPNFSGVYALPSPVNSAANDDAPAIRYAGPPADNTLFFSSDRAGGQGGFDILTATLTGTIWGNVTPLTTTINGAGDDMYPFTATFNGKTVMFFVRNAAIYVSEYSGGNWQLPTVINLGAGNSYHPCLVGTGEGAKLYFSSNRAGGQGYYDIWVATYTGGNWAEPVNLGTPINTGYNEHSPAVSVDGSTLYFASTRTGGLGGYDLWYSVENPSVDAASFGKTKAVFR